MDPYRRTTHTRVDINSHMVWITKYCKKILRGDVGPRLRQIVRTISTEPEVEILKGHVSSDHVHLFVPCRPLVSASYLMQRLKGVSASYLMQRLKGKSPRNLIQAYNHLEKLCGGRYLWARGFFVAGSGNLTDEVIMGYIRPEMAKEDDDFRVDEAWASRSRSGFQPTDDSTGLQSVES